LALQEGNNVIPFSVKNCKHTNTPFFGTGFLRVLLRAVLFMFYDILSIMRKFDAGVSCCGVWFICFVFDTPCEFVIIAPYANVRCFSLLPKGDY
jgi:hypothetical protein